MTLIAKKDSVSTILKHIHALAVDIGPRGSTTENERRGAMYCREAFKAAGLNPIIETFRSARSIFQPHMLASILYLTAFAIYPLSGRTTAVIAAILTIITLASELLELGFKDNLLRRVLPKGESQNVHATIAASQDYQQDLVLIGHIDTQRTPLIFRTARWVKAYQNFTTIAFVLFLVQSALFIGGVIFTWSWSWFASIPSAVCAAILAGICIQAEVTPFTAGANDNASAVGMVLALAEEFSQAPLDHTRVTCVCTGCEEVQHYGAIDFFKHHRHELNAPKALVFELLGCAGPGWLTSEGIIVPFHSDQHLQEAAEAISLEHPEWGAYPVKISGGNSELADCVRAGVPAITLFGLTSKGEAPHWHQVADTYDKIDAKVLEKTHAMALALIQQIDSHPS